MIECVDVRTALVWFQEGTAQFVDVRETAELKLNGSIPGAAHAPRSQFEWHLDPEDPNFAHALRTERKLVFFCGSGGRSALSARLAAEMGYANVVSMDGGFKGWVAAGGPVEER
jgi:rhodanese-related sulfurtransferase